MFKYALLTGECDNTIMYASQVITLSFRGVRPRQLTAVYFLLAVFDHLQLIFRLKLKYLNFKKKFVCTDI